MFGLLHRQLAVLAVHGEDLAAEHVNVNRLRRKLGLQNDIQTVYKVGYRLNSAN